MWHWVISVPSDRDKSIAPAHPQLQTEAIPLGREKRIPGARIEEGLEIYPEPFVT